MVYQKYYLEMIVKYSCGHLIKILLVGFIVVRIG